MIVAQLRVVDNRNSSSSMFDVMVALTRSSLP